jgi:uncharacterized membrane protein
MWMWGLFMGSIATVGFGALAGRIFALVRRQQLEGTPFASHVKTATKVFDVSVLVVVFAAIATHELTKIPAFASLAADHMVDTAFVSFVFVLLPAWLSLWGVFGFLRAKRGEPFGRP